MNKKSKVKQIIVKPVKHPKLPKLSPDLQRYLNDREIERIKNYG